MDEIQICRICMTGENLTSIFSIMDGGKISDKINFVCGLKITQADAFPKHICHQCVSSIIIASSIKRKSLETEKIFQEMAEDVDSIDDDQFSVEEVKIDPMKRKYMIYEEDSENDSNQPKMNYNVTRSTVKIDNINHFNYNPELRRFVKGYIEDKPHLELIKITDKDCIKDIEMVLALSQNSQGSSQSKRMKIAMPSITIGSLSQNRVASQKRTTIQPSSSKLLNALAGHRFGNGRS